MIVSLCDESGVMVRPWADAGFSCICYDLQHSIRNDRVVDNVTYRWGDVRSLTLEDLPEPPQIIFAFPPCTDLAVSGARDFAKKGLRRFIDALELVEACRVFCGNSGVPWMLENPVSRLSTSWRQPDYTFDPWQYGDGYTKKTCIWAGGGFVMPKPSVRKKPATADSRMHKMPPSDDRAKLRSVTPAGFAAAVYAANVAQVRAAAR